jgi:hypothetical protein
MFAFVSFQDSTFTLLLFPPDVSLFTFMLFNDMTAFFRDASHPDSQHPSSNTSKKPRRVRTQLYGYVLTQDWINGFAARKQIGTPGHYLDTSSSVVFHILRETRFRRAYAVKWGDSIALCIAVAHNKSAEGLQLATFERIERVKRVMEVDAEPSWFNAA